MVDLRDVDGFTPLHDASRKNEPEVAEGLIEAEANVNAKTKRDPTPLHLAAGNNALASIKMVQSGCVWSVLYPSVASVVCTFLVCVLGWAVYDWGVKMRDEKREGAKDAANQPRQRVYE